jgi:hypothetical protein
MNLYSTCDNFRSCICSPTNCPCRRAPFPQSRRAPVHFSARSEQADSPPRGKTRRAAVHSDTAQGCAHGDRSGPDSNCRETRRSHRKIRHNHPIRRCKVEARRKENTTTGYGARLFDRPSSEAEEEPHGRSLVRFQIGFPGAKGHPGSQLPSSLFWRWVSGVRQPGLVAVLLFLLLLCVDLRLLGPA